jgi:hypothetical protein
VLPTVPAVNRRRLLAAGGLLAVLAVAAACDSAPPPVDKLEAQRQLALRDSELVTAAAVTAPPEMTQVLTEVAAERAEHAHALATEIGRLAGDAAPSPTETSEQAADFEPAPPPPRVSDVVAALREAADSAGSLATELSGYRAGLLASIAAACTAAGTVMLATQP